MFSTTDIGWTEIVHSTNDFFTAALAMKATKKPLGKVKALKKDVSESPKIFDAVPKDIGAPTLTAAMPNKKNTAPTKRAQTQAKKGAAKKSSNTSPTMKVNNASVKENDTTEPQEVTVPKVKVAGASTSMDIIKKVGTRTKKPPASTKEVTDRTLNASPVKKTGRAPKKVITASSIKTPVLRKKPANRAHPKAPKLEIGKPPRRTATKKVMKASRNQTDKSAKNRKQKQMPSQPKGNN